MVWKWAVGVFVLYDNHNVGLQVLITNRGAYKYSNIERF